MANLIIGVVSSDRILIPGVLSSLSPESPNVVESIQIVRSHPLILSDSTESGRLSLVHLALPPCR